LWLDFLTRTKYKDAGPSDCTRSFYLFNDTNIANGFIGMDMQELKGNVRVFCRVRPLLVEDEDSEQTQSVVEYPQAGELVGRGIELVQAEGK
jgi:hypothetical protein